MSDTTVKFYHSGMTGHPTLTGQAGSLIALLDACLVNGFGVGTVDSVVIASGVATVTRAAGHPFEAGQVALIAGATVSGGTINGEQRVLSTTVTTYTFDATGLANQTATGTITHKAAPAGWVKAFSTTNIAAYKSGDVAATGCLLRVDDTGTTNARVVGYETMTVDVNGGVAPFPTAAQISGGGYWGKSATADAVERAWMLFADARTFHLAIQWSGTASYGTVTFGDMLSVKSPDAYACTILCGGGSAVGGNPGSNVGDLSYSHVSSYATGSYLTRALTGLGSSVAALRTHLSQPCGNTAGLFSGAPDASRINYPNPADNGLYLSQMGLVEPSSYRGAFPGAMYCPQSVGVSALVARDRVTNVAGYTGREFRTVPNATGVMFIDATGPWR